MVKHIVIWQHGDGFTDEEKRVHAAGIKRELEALAQVIEGVVSIRVVIDPLPTSNGDILLDSTFEDEAALNAYLVHPEHKRVGSTFVRPFIKNRACIDCVL